MKKLTIYNLFPACLVYAILLIFGVLAGTATGLTPLQNNSNQVQAKPVSHHPAPALADQVFTSTLSLPGTALNYPAPAGPPQKVAARLASDTKNTELHTFVTQVRDGKADRLRGVFVSGVFALPVVQQPAKNSLFVSNKQNMVTQFQNAAQNGVTGLLAHNYLAGRLFYELVPGHEVMLVYGDGFIKRYQVTGIHRFKKLEPANPRSSLVDLSTGKRVTVVEVFNNFYRGEHRLTFQTCLARYGKPDWGLIFVEAIPLESQ